MNSHLSEEQITGWIAGERGREAEQHIRECPACTAEVERCRKAFLLFRDSGYACAEYWRTQPPVPSPRRVARWVLAASSLVALAIILATVILHRHTRQVPREEPSGQEVFQRIPYVVPPAPYERTEVVRMDVPVAALISAGFKMSAVAGDSVPADVLVGQDGRPLAVGFPEDKE